MKRILLLLGMGIGIIQFTNAQSIELTGKGVLDLGNTATLTFLDLASIDHIVVEAAAIFSTVPANVEFSNFLGSQSVEFNLTQQNLGEGVPNPVIGERYKGYYTATFNDVDNTGITLNKNSQGESIISFTAYVYRNSGSPEIWSMKMDDHAFVYENGSCPSVNYRGEWKGPLVYNIAIPISEGFKDIEVVIPFTDVASDINDLRWAMVKATAGTISDENEFVDNNKGNLLRLEKLVLANVPGDITNVEIVIISPDAGSCGDTKSGDSFITGSVLLTTTDLGCTHTQGYWKTHSEEYGPASKPDLTWAMVGGPDANFFLSDTSYIGVLNTSPKGNAYYILAHQYIAAELNFWAGADNSAVIDAFNEATGLLNTYTPADIKSKKGNDPVRKMFTDLGGILDDYNNGLIGPGHCVESEEEWEKSARISNEDISISDFVVYPNPVKNSVTISFNPAFDGKATVELYNMLGQKTAILLNQNVQKDIPLSLKFDVHQFTEGLYLIVVKNGTSRESTKIDIRK